MSKWWLIVGAVAILVVLVYGAVVLFAPAPKTTPAPTPTLPTSGTASGTQAGGDTLSMPLAGGGAVRTRDFLKDATVVADPHNPGYYYLGYHASTGSGDTTASAAPPYVITYIATTHYFNIGLYTEPIGQTRIAAENYLTNTLGISRDELCALKYMVSVPDTVNSRYSGQNLGFSFCKGAVLLPQ